MLRIAKALYQSRKAWVGGLTILLMAVFAVWIGPLLNLTADQSAQIALAIVAAGVAIIAGIAIEDGGAKSAGGGGAPAVLLLLCLAGLAATAGGCQTSQAVLRTLQFEIVQVDTDKDLVGQLFMDRQAATDALIWSANRALEISIRQREADAKAGKTAKGPDGKDVAVVFDAAWVIETTKGNAAIVGLLTSRARSDERARAEVIDNFNARREILDKAAKVVVQSQQWSSETATLVSDLFKATLAKPTPSALAPLVGLESSAASGP